MGRGATDTMLQARCRPRCGSRRAASQAQSRHRGVIRRELLAHKGQYCCIQNAKGQRHASGTRSAALTFRLPQGRGPLVGACKSRKMANKMANPWLLEPKVTADFAPYEVISDAKGERKTHRAA